MVFNQYLVYIYFCMFKFDNLHEQTCSYTELYILIYKTFVLLFFEKLKKIFLEPLLQNKSNIYEVSFPHVKSRFVILEARYDNKVVILWSKFKAFRTYLTVNKFVLSKILFRSLIYTELKLVIIFVSNHWCSIEILNHAILIVVKKWVTFNIFSPKTLPSPWPINNFIRTNKCDIDRLSGN